jgi:uncharacterized protein
MDSLLFAALISGLIGSFHCLGMCGPIVLMLPRPAASRGAYVMNRLYYNLGRIVTYSILGAICGLLGHLVVLAGFQQTLSIAAGIAILLGIFLPSRIARQVSPSIMTNISDKIRTLWGRLLNSHSVGSLFLIGLLNGLLPCGLLYVALAAATTTGSILRGVIYMALFGLGTVPMLLILSLFGRLMPSGMRKMALRLLPIGAVLIALLLILRGLSLGIPYISPNMRSLNRQITPSTTSPLPLNHDCCK